jgi:hypothetical protein
MGDATFARGSCGAGAAGVDAAGAKTPPNSRARWANSESRGSSASRSALRVRKPPQLASRAVIAGGSGGGMSG